MITETLAPDVAWEPSGHLSEVALSAAADGEDALLDEPMHAHLASCEACTRELGRVALRSARVAEAFTEMAAHAKDHAPEKATVTAAALFAPPRKLGAPAPAARARRNIPLLAIAAALAVAVLGAAPSMLSMPAEAAQTWNVVRKVAPSFLRMLPQALSRAWSGPGGSMVVLVWGLSAVLIATGFGIAKRASKKVLVDGGRS